MRASVLVCVRGMPEREKGNRGSTVRTLPACTVLAAHGVGLVHEGSRFSLFAVVL